MGVVFIFYSSALMAGRDFVADPCKQMCHYKKSIEELRCALKSNNLNDSEKRNLFFSTVQTYLEYQTTKELIKDCIDSNGKTKANLDQEIDNLGADFELWLRKFQAAHPQVINIQEKIELIDLEYNVEEGELFENGEEAPPYHGVVEQDYYDGMFVSHLLMDNSY